MLGAARAQLLVEGRVEWRCDYFSPEQHARADDVRVKQCRAQLLLNEGHADAALSASSAHFIVI